MLDDIHDDAYRNDDEIPPFEEYPDFHSGEYNNFDPIPEYHDYYEEFPTVYYENARDEPEEEEERRRDDRSSRSSGASASTSAAMAVGTSAIISAARGGSGQSSLGSGSRGSSGSRGRSGSRRGSSRGSAAGGSSTALSMSVIAATFVALVAVAGFVIPALENADLNVDMDVDYGGDTLVYTVSLSNMSANARYYVVVLEEYSVVFEKEITEGYQTGIVEGLDGTKDHKVEIRTGLVPIHVVGSETIPGQSEPFVPVEINRLEGVENTIEFDMTVKEGSEAVTLGIYAAEGQGAVFTQALNPGANSGTATGLMFNHEYIVKIFGAEKTYIIKAVTTEKMESDIVIEGIAGLDYNTAEKALVTRTGNTEQTVQYSVDGGANWITTIPEFTNAGVYTVMYKADETDNYKALAEGSVTVTVAKVTSDLQFAANENLTYADAGTELISKVSGNDEQVIQYSLNGTDWVTEAPVVTAAGSFTVYYMAEASTNYEAAPQGSFDVTVDKADSDISVTGIAGLDYDTPEKALVTRTGNTEQTVQYSTDGGANWITTIPEFTAIGDYTVRFKADATDNYKALAEDSVVVNVAKTDATITAPTAIADLMFTGSSQTLINAGTSENGTVKYSLTVDGTFTTDLPAGTAADTYNVYYMVEGDTNHNDLAPSEERKVSVEIANPLTNFNVVIPQDNSQITYSADTISAGEWSLYVVDNESGTIVAERYLATGDDISVTMTSWDFDDKDIGRMDLTPEKTYSIYANIRGITDPADAEENTLYDGTVKITYVNTISATIDDTVDVGGLNVYINFNNDAYKNGRTTWGLYTDAGCTTSAAGFDPRSPSNAQIPVNTSVTRSTSWPDTLYIGVKLDGTLVASKETPLLRSITGMTLTYDSTQNVVSWSAESIMGRNQWSVYLLEGDTVVDSYVLPTNTTGIADLQIEPSATPYDVYVNVAGLDDAAAISANSKAHTTADHPQVATFEFNLIGTTMYITADVNLSDVGGYQLWYYVDSTDAAPYLQNDLTGLKDGSVYKWDVDVDRSEAHTIKVEIRDGSDNLFGSADTYYVPAM